MSSGEPACVFCFFSLPNVGYLYSLKGGVELLSTYQYPEKVLEAALTDHLLHVITKYVCSCKGTEIQESALEVSLRDLAFILKSDPLLYLRHNFIEEKEIHLLHCIVRKHWLTLWLCLAGVLCSVSQSAVQQWRPGLKTLTLTPPWRYEPRLPHHSSSFRKFDLFPLVQKCQTVSHPGPHPLHPTPPNKKKWKNFKRLPSWKLYFCSKITNFLCIIFCIYNFLYII